MAKKPIYQTIPKKVELFGRTISTLIDADRLGIRKVYGEAKYGENQIILNPKISEKPITADELKLTYLHEMMHFILNFTSYEQILSQKGIDIEQFIELMASGIYQYEKSAVY